MSLALALLLSSDQLNSPRREQEITLPNDKTLPSQFKIMVLHQQIMSGSYDIDGKMDIVVERLLCEYGVLN